ncbi:hypothetical protein [Stappia sp. ES.058]|uniref:hypothetical protein n=1 Tax=Stappia sp. ES.058 TaxID=1881061 RepID=UPI00087A40A7|nr:hypothetical protein [Stappia sp. ES.058]SDT95501.1 hypothetical protein SAMN05428979_0696 [Stappia sp. ES.058]
MHRFSFVAAAFVASLVSLPAQASSEYFTYKDWTVLIEQLDTGEDLRTTCKMWTGGDGDPTVEIALSDGDALPPTIYPGVSLMERAYRGQATVLNDGDQVNFVFDDGDSVTAGVQAGFDPDGYAFARTQFAEVDKQRALQAMRANGIIDIVGPEGTFYTASLNGFTAAYIKLAEQCGFTTQGVID